MKLTGTPKRDGFLMPGEFEPHSGTLMIWPERPGSWPYGAKAARRAFAEIAAALAKQETVYMLAGKSCIEDARAHLPPQVNIVEMESDDAWARDVGPTFVVNGSGAVRGIDWRFNAWGGTYDGLYPNWGKDDAVAAAFCRELGMDYYDAGTFVLEGGSIHSDGESTVLATEACLLSPGRNPGLSKTEIEQMLREFLSAEKIIWLPHGIYGDETNEHVDNICAFIRPGEVVLAWTEDQDDPQYSFSREDLAVLERERDAKGRRFLVHRLPLPQNPVCITQEDLDGFVFEPGEDTREAGERLAASYVNFYIGNGIVLVPQFGDPNDAKAVELLQSCFPERKAVPVYARDIIVGGGNIHCITQQIPGGRHL